jgi:hypothetical protein
VNTRRLAHHRLIAAAFAGFASAGAWSCGNDPVKVDVEDSANGFVDLADDPGTSSGSSALLPELDDACLSQTAAAEQRRVALNVMLDSSGSMEEATGSGATKWQAVQRAIRSFLLETRDSDLSIGLQFFPLLKPGVTDFTCDSHDDCGPDGGPCFLSTCLQGETITLCTTQADCPGSPSLNPCVDFGLCADSDPASPTACVLPSTCGNGLGRCEDFERTCTNATQCDVSYYATPTVEIGPVADALGPIDRALNEQPPQGLTPTVPALEGAIQHSREWSVTHPDQTVVTVLATDGLPTECGPNVNGAPAPIEQVLEIARAGVNDALPIRTFVIGVFPPGDGASLNNVNAIAVAGGTQEAVLIDAGGEVEAEFLDALRQIREGTLACQFEIPQTEEQLDYFRVNLLFDNGTEQQQLGYVPDEASCASSPNSWHYDVPVDANTSGTRPNAIQVCPAVCDQFRAATSGSITLQLGCRTLLR